MPMSFRNISWTIAMAGVLWAATAGAGAPDFTQQRAGFEAAERALKSGDQPRFQSLLKTLGDYPLYPYLIYEDLQSRLNKAGAAEIQAFLTIYPDTPLAPRLRVAWLQLLAQQGRWQELLAAYLPTDDAQAQCLYRRALLETGDTTKAVQGLESLWLTGRAQPEACNRPFDAWRFGGGMSDALIWQRMTLALDAGQLDVARALDRFLAPDDRRWAEVWLQVHQKPELIFDAARFEGAHPVIPVILAHGIKRLARSDAAKAAAAWDDIGGRYTFGAAERDTLARILALAFAAQKLPEARARLEALTPAQEDQQVREKRVALALAESDWAATQRWIARLNNEERATPRWRYWQARALEKTGSAKDAEAIYTELASGRDYYGLLAADRLEKPYALTHRPLSFPDEELATLERAPGILRAREFYLLARPADASREWSHATLDMSEAQLLRAARLAHGWGWHDRAIATVARAPRQDDLELIFPLAHRERVESHAQGNGIDPAWVFGILRQESAFVSDARSPVGALGLMQIMPATGEMIAKSLKTRLSSPNDLLAPDTSIRFGAAYLRSRLAAFDNNPVLATAAYNAGAGRVRQWLAPDRIIEADLWVENIPFKETRDYVRRVLAYTVIYRQRLGNPPILLSKLMPPVGSIAAASRE
ncbi:MAG: transglycosylase SLT domain-containing protein [Gammaproteobacteria bacterium]|nr:transglycosylase SLT domain-containing protein [Gammaproteobacteria bacterium]